MSDSSTILSSSGVSGDAETDGDASLRRWARAIIRARMRNPCRNCSCCPAVYATDDPFEDVVDALGGLFLSALLIPLPRVGLGGIADWLTAVATGYPVAIYQSAGLEERALSLARGIHSCSGPDSPLMRQLRIGHDPARGLRDGRGQYTETNSLRVADSSRFQAGTGKERLSTGPKQRTLCVMVPLRVVCKLQQLA